MTSHVPSPGESPTALLGDKDDLLRAGNVSGAVLGALNSNIDPIFLPERYSRRVLESSSPSTAFASHESANAPDVREAGVQEPQHQPHPPPESAAIFAPATVSPVSLCYRLSAISRYLYLLSAICSYQTIHCTLLDVSASRAFATSATTIAHVWSMPVRVPGLVEFFHQLNKSLNECRNTSLKNQRSVLLVGASCLQPQVCSVKHPVPTAPRRPSPINCQYH
jgi:hypothetical protein